MNEHNPSCRETRNRRGFTVTEVMIALTLSGVVMATVMTAFIWTGRQTSLCSKIAWSQAEAMRTCKKIESYLRNASGIAAIDEMEGNWIQVRFPGDSIGTFFYSNTSDTLRGGRLYLIHGGKAELLVARGLTRIMDADGGRIKLFTPMGSQGIRVAYRVAEPTPGGTEAANDGLYAAVVNFAVCMRNFTE